MSRFRLRIGFCLAVLAIGLIFLGVQDTAPTSAAAEPQANAQAIARVMQVQDRNTDRLMAIKGVVGTATGLNAAGQPVVRVFLAKAGVPGIPAKLEGVPVVAEVTGTFHALGHTTAKYRPAPIGVSTGHPNITAGTIGCRVTDGTNVYALSNNHVYADQNNANIGDNVLQPGTYDGGKDPDDKIGTLYDFEPIVFKRQAKNKIDAAIALSSTDLLGTATLEGGYGTPNSTIVGAVLGQKVQKFGRTTELTKGEITGVNATVNVGYGPGKTAKFVDQIIIEPGGFSAGGDSGSLIVTDDDNLNPVGLLFAGSSTITVANRIDLVLAEFGVTIDDGTGGEPPPPPNEPPTVSIISPVDGATFTSGATIDFAGSATDTEDEDTTLTASLAWTSNIDGPIGTGGSFSTTLSDGNHTITASVTDTGGLDGSDSISITVGTPPPPPPGVTVTDIVPATMQAGTTVKVTITGSGFVDSADVTFESGAGPTPRVSNVVVVDASTITATVTAKAGGPPRDRFWDVRVTNPDGSSGVLAGGFTVTP